MQMYTMNNDNVVTCVFEINCGDNYDRSDFVQAYVQNTSPVNDTLIPVRASDLNAILRFMEKIIGDRSDIEVIGDDAISYERMYDLLGLVIYSNKNNTD